MLHKIQGFLKHLAQFGAKCLIPGEVSGYINYVTLKSSVNKVNMENLVG